MKLCAIDPGLKGAMVMFDKDKPTGIIRLSDIYAGDNPPRTLLTCFMLNKFDCIVLEDVHAIFGDGAKAAYTFGFNNGILDAAISIAKIDLYKVSPMRWMNEMHKGLPKTTATKERSAIVARTMYPEITKDLKDSDDGIFDALLIGAWFIKNGGKDG